MLTPYQYNVLLQQSGVRLGIALQDSAWACTMNWLIDHKYLHIVQEPISVLQYSGTYAVWRPTDKGKAYLDMVRANAEC